jgi:hypothetical protein
VLGKMAGKKEDDVSSVEVSDEEMEEGDEEFYDPGPSDLDVVSKYKLASDIANRALVFCLLCVSFVFSPVPESLQSVLPAKACLS